MLGLSPCRTAGILAQLETHHATGLDCCKVQGTSYNVIEQNKHEHNKMKSGCLIEAGMMSSE